MKDFDFKKGVLFKYLGDYYPEQKGKLQIVTKIDTEKRHVESVFFGKSTKNRFWIDSQYARDCEIVSKQ